MTVYLPWQDQQWGHLDGLLQQQKLPHAFLLSGSAGVGKKRFALAFAQYLMCESPKLSMACGECRQCLLNLANTHPDIKNLEPAEVGKQIKVDEIRDLVAYLSHTSQQGGYKVAILAPAEAMNVNAANALLKSLEEPAAKTLLLLLTDNLGQLLPTIRSRCQLVKFPLPSREAALSWLGALLPTREAMEQLLDDAACQPLTAQQLLLNDGLERRQQLNNDLLALLSGRASALGIAASWLDHELADVLNWFSRKLMVLISYSLAGDQAGVTLGRDWQLLSAQADTRWLFQLLDKVNLLQRRIARGANPNQQLALEELLLETCDKFHSAV